MPDYLVTTILQQEQLTSEHKALPVRKERLVRAKNEAAAIKHVVADTITVDRATIDDAMRLAKAGVSVETAD